jgi:hypothetical protein
MATFYPVKSYQFIPESYLPNVPYIPIHFMPQQQVLNATNFEYEIDTIGQTSIIRLVNSNEIILPFIDLAKYDPETKDFFWYDPDDNFPYRFHKSNKSLETIYPSPYSGLVLNDLIEFNKDTKRIEADFIDYDGSLPTFYKYSPLIVTVNNRAFNDLSDYSTFQSTNRLNRIDSLTPEFYYDFESRIYTNQNLAGLDPEQVKIYFYRISDNNVIVKCRLSANTGKEAFYTPRVNSFIVKIKGQSLRT